MKRRFSKGLSLILLTKKIIVMKYTSNILFIKFTNIFLNKIFLLNQTTHILDFIIKKLIIKY